MALMGLGKFGLALQQLRSVAACSWKAALLVRQQQLPGACLSRQLAAKSSKGKSQKHASAKISINASLVEEIIDLKDVECDMRTVLDNLKEDFTKNLNIRTSPGAFDHIVVTTKDGRFPISHLGQITVKSPRLFHINMSSFPEVSYMGTISLIKLCDF
ncbi:unnamed protein product [Staurois parvus]|uniref:Ribosome-recycling factor, mitochondrial n=1 Tax=Staurois parvus TaxID=386267 RepID=A0ABN9A8Q0_9NEOB|nr:unnamed protein product [Staurois parvus]